MTDYVPVLDLSKYIEKHFFGERPHVRGRRVPVAVIAQMYHEGEQSAQEIAHDLTLSESEILAALLYYAEYRNEIEAQEAAYEAVSIEDWMKYGKDAVLLRRDDTYLF